MDTHYIIAIIASIIAVILIKRLVGCMMRAVVTIALLAILAYLYYFHLT